MTNDIPDNVEELLQQVNAGQPPKLEHTLLAMWSNVMSNIEQSEAQPLGFAQTLSLSQRWPEVGITRVPELNWAYHSNLLVLRQILLDEIAKDPECFKHVDDDAEYNRTRYLNLLGGWQHQIIEWERRWDRHSSDAPIWLAACLMAGDFVLGEKGLVAHLDQIGFTLTEEEARELTEQANQIDETAQAG